MNKGQDIIDLAFDLVLYNQSVKYDVYDLLKSFLNDTEQIDLRTICKLEFILDNELIIFPTKKELRAMKLKKISNIIKK